MTREMNCLASGGGILEADNFDNSASGSSYSVDVGFPIKKLVVTELNSNNSTVVCIYDSDIDTTTYMRHYPNSSTVDTIPLNSSSYTGLYSVVGSVFTLTSDTMHSIRYIAIG